MNGEFNYSANIPQDEMGWDSSPSSKVYTNNQFETNTYFSGSIGDKFNFLQVPVDLDLNSSGVTEQANLQYLIASPEISVLPTSSTPKPIDSCQQRSNGSIDSTEKPTCTCLIDAVTVLENLEILQTRSHQKSLRSMGGTLSLNKDAVARCNAMLDCPICQRLSSVVMILILIGRHLVSLFSQLLANHFHNDDREVTRCEPATTNTTWLGGYSIDTPEEWKEMLRGLAIIQVKSLGSFLSRMRATLSCTNWTAHQTILGEIDSQYSHVMESLARSSQSE
ncbi:hypothetical protein F5Y12DRAFT_737924 [Xylaria sp. FL1777]|nr:hypothetical protein F5Y12DRAFT_737924 [Xylaria sp. FL1777]